MKRNITLSVLLISLLAVGVYAQTESDPAKEQIHEQIRNEENLQNQEQLQNQDETQNQEQINNQEQIQEENQLQTRKNNEVLEGDKSLEGEKPQTGVQERVQPEDPIREIGSDENAQNPGNGTADRKFVGPNDSSGDKVLDGECDGDQTREMNHGDADGTGDGLVVSFEIG